MKLIFSIFLLLISNTVFSQPTRREIIESKIKSVSTIFYEETVGGQRKYSGKTYYSIKGDDSLEYVDSVLAYVFTPEVNEGKITMLTRKAAEGETEEIHLYEYRPDGSYTIEIIAQGAGTISFKEFNRQNDCLSEILSGTDTLAYLFNSLGKIREIKKKDKGEWRIVARTTFDEKGFPVETISLGEPSGRMIYKNNSFGLPEEITQYYKSNSKEILVGRVVIVYEFWQ